MRQVADVLNSLPRERINIIDVGCYVGRITQEVVGHLPGRDIFSIGIDPVDHAKWFQFTHFVRAAIRNCQPTEAVLHHYSDPMCNSLLKMTENVTHDHAERDVKWFGAHDFDRLLGTSQVQVCPLSVVVEQFGLQDATIHFLKIDAQGLDLEVLLSLGKYIGNCLVVQMEQITSHRKDMVLYEGQTIYEDELPIIEGYGFEVLSVEDYSLAGASFEADVVYVNTKLLEELQHG